MAIDSPADPNLCLKEFRLSISGFGFDHFQCGLDVYICSCKKFHSKKSYKRKLYTCTYNCTRFIQNTSVSH